MADQKYIEITNAVYKIIDFFPEEDILQNKAKEKALAIMENLTLMSLPELSHKKGRMALDVFRDIEILMGYLRLAKEKSWLDNMNFFIISEEYEKIRREIQPLVQAVSRELVLIKEEQKVIVPKPVDNIVQKAQAFSGFEGPLSERQQKIIEILKNQEKVQVADLKNILPDVSKRTLRRDLDDLLKRRRVVRFGEFNQIFYKIYKVLPVVEANKAMEPKATFEV